MHKLIIALINKILDLISEEAIDAEGGCLLLSEIRRFNIIRSDEHTEQILDKVSKIFDIISEEAIDVDDACALLNELIQFDPIKSTSTNDVLDVEIVNTSVKTDIADNITDDITDDITGNIDNKTDMRVINLDDTTSTVKNLQSLKDIIKEKIADSGNQSFSEKLPSLVGAAFFRFKVNNNQLP